jgi:hypothetical protein
MVAVIDPLCCFPVNDILTAEFLDLFSHVVCHPSVVPWRLHILTNVNSMSTGGDTTLRPFVFSPSQSWAGNDGRWSTFIVRAGTPEQNFGVLPSTGAPEILLPLPEGCTSSDPPNCGELRGAYPFNGNVSSGYQIDNSSTWKSMGLYTIDLADNLLGDGNNGLYGTDSIGLMLQNSGGLKVNDQIIGGIATKDVCALCKLFLILYR